MKHITDDFHSLQHEMQLETTYPSGVQEWFCPTCDRRFVMRMPPNFNRIMLDVGDETVSHSGSTGGLRIGTVQAREADEPELSDELRAALEDLLEDTDLDDLLSAAG